MNPTRLDPARILQTLRQVKDPELDCNIVDLGLVYGVAIDGAKVVVTMTLTSPGCPMSDSIRWGVQSALLNLEGVEDAEVNVVWDPPWTPDRMNALGRAATGVA